MLDKNLARHVPNLDDVFMGVSTSSEPGTSFICTWNVKVSKRATFPESMNKLDQDRLRRILLLPDIKTSYITLLKKALKANLGKVAVDFTAVKDFNAMESGDQMHIIVSVSMLTTDNVTNLHDDIGAQVIDMASAKLYKAILQSLVDVELDFRNLVASQYDAPQIAINRLNAFRGIKTN